MVVSPWDALGAEEVPDEIELIETTRIRFKHWYGTPKDAAGHVKAAIVGHSRTFFIEKGRATSPQ